MHPDGLARGRAFKKLRAGHPCRPQIGSQALGHLVDVDRPSSFTEDVHLLGGVGLKVAAPNAERRSHAGIERPSARIVGLVLVETHHAALKIHVAPA
ncbi:MAG: hypothetical protein ABSC94_26830 [Polyangiaceae bacterium]